VLMQISSEGIRVRMLFLIPRLGVSRRGVGVVKGSLRPKKKHAS